MTQMNGYYCWLLLNFGLNKEMVKAAVERFGNSAFILVGL